MKKLLIVVSMLLLIFVSVTESAQKAEKKFSISVGAGVRTISADHFDDVFSGTNIAISVDLAYRVAGPVELFLHTDYLSIKGELTETKEETKFTLFPAELGLRFILSKGNFVPYIGGGAGYYMIEDVHTIGTVKENRFGFFGEGGLKIVFAQQFFVDLKLKYNILKSEADVDLGGLAYMGSIGIMF